MFSSDSFAELEPRFQVPDGWQWATLARDGYDLRYGYTLPLDVLQGRASLRKMIVALPGLSEFCEKYFELAHDCLAQGYGFLVLDWRGQGQSSRYLDNPDKRHSQGFINDAKDLDAVLSACSFLQADTALCMMAHSMGGNIGLRFLEAFPGRFKTAAFSAPLIGLHAFAHVPEWAATSLLAPLVRFCPNEYAPMGGDWDPLSRDFQNDILFSKDKVRARVHNYWMKSDKSLRVGHVTNQWLYDAHQSCLHIQHDLDVSGFDFPCLFFTAGYDTLVDNEKIKALTARLPQSQLVEFPEARHEIWMEHEDIRSDFLNRFYSLVNKIHVD